MHDEKSMFLIILERFLSFSTMRKHAFAGRKTQQIMKWNELRNKSLLVLDKKVWIANDDLESLVKNNIFLFNQIYYSIFFFTLLFTPGARLPVLGPFLAGGAFGSNT